MNKEVKAGGWGFRVGAKPFAESDAREIRESDDCMRVRAVTELDWGAMVHHHTQQLAGVVTYERKQAEQAGRRPAAQFHHKGIAARGL